MKIGLASPPVRCPPLPLEIIQNIISFLDHFPIYEDLVQRQQQLQSSVWARWQEEDLLEWQRQHTLWSCCLISRAWYSVTVKILYRSPLLTSTNFEFFTRTICPTTNSKTRAVGLERLVVDLDMGRIAYESSKHMTARLLHRTMPSLETFVSPARTFSSTSLVPVSKSVKLRRLDLSSDSYKDYFDIDDLLQSIHNLNRLQFLSLPQHSVSYRNPLFPGSRSGSRSGLQWPPCLFHLQITGSAPMTTEGWNDLISSFPQTLKTLEFVHLTDLDGFPHLSRAKATAPQIQQMRIEDPDKTQDWLILGDLLPRFPFLASLTIPCVAWLREDFALLDQPFPADNFVATKLERLQLTRNDPSDSMPPPSRLYNLASMLTALRRIDIECCGLTLFDLSDSDTQKLVRLLNSRDYPGFTFESGLFEL